MKNRLNLILTICFTIFSFSLSAQGLYGGLEVSYGLPASADQYLGAKTVENIPPADLISFANINTTVGQGLGAHLLLGYNFTPSFGFEFDVSYFIGSAARIEERTTEKSWIGNPPALATGGPGIRYNEVSSQQIRVAPTVVIRGAGARFRPIAKFGLLIPVGGSAKSVTFIDDPYLVSPLVPAFPQYNGTVSTFQEATIEAEISGAFSVGFQSGLGFEMRLSDALDLRANLYYQALRVKRHSLEIKSAEVTFIEDLPNEDVMYLLNLGGAFAYTEYYDEINQAELEAAEALVDANGETTYGTTANPARALREDGNYNNLGLDVGIIFNLGRGSEN